MYIYMYIYIYIHICIYICIYIYIYIQIAQIDFAKLNVKMLGTWKSGIFQVKK